MDSLERTLAEMRSKAAELRNSFGDEERARAIEWAASLVERALQEHAEERLTLAEASARSAYSHDHLARLIREGRLPNAGRPHAPRGDDPVGALDVGSFVEAVRDRVCDVPRQQSEYPARRRGTSKVAARVLWRALRLANADRSRSIGVRRCRKAGGVVLADGTKTRPVRTRSVEM